MKSFNLGNIEIMSHDLSYRDNKINTHPRIKGIEALTYDMAISLAKQYGDDWRLPTILEFKFLNHYYQTLNILNFKRDSYWSSTDIPEGINNQFAYYMGSGIYGGIPKSQRLRVRLIKDI